MKLKRIYFITLLLVVSLPVSATPNTLELLHKIKLNTCLHMEGCDKDKIRQCRAMVRQGFAICDSEFHKNPKSTTNWGGCMGCYLKAHMSGREFAYMMHGQACADPDKKTSAQTGGGTPQAAPSPRFFTPTGLDINNPVLKFTPIAACGAGAKRTQEMINKTYRDMRVDIEVSDAKKTNAVSGPGHGSYSLMLGETVHKYGKCYGKKVFTYLKKHGKHNKGDRIKNDYKEDLYVVIDCSVTPKATICE